MGCPALPGPLQRWNIERMPTTLPRGTPQNLEPLHDLSRVVLNLCFISVSWKLRECIETDRQRQTILFIDIDISVMIFTTCEIYSFMKFICHIHLSYSLIIYTYHIH